jgi:TniB protein
MNTNNLSIVDQILVPHTAFEQATRRIRQLHEMSVHTSEPLCLALVGESRTGKSRVLESIRKLYPCERRDEGLHVPIIRIETPSKPTVKGLVETLLHAIGDPLWNRRGSEIEKTERLLILLRKTSTTMVMLDEFQHFYDKTSHKVQHQVADWLKIFVDKANIALIVSGLPSCMAVINQNEQLRGRFVGALHMPRFDWCDEVKRNDFIAILDAYQESMPDLNFPNMGSDNVAFRFYCASGGLIGYVAKILRQAVATATFNDTKSITLADLAVAYRDAVWRDDIGPSVNPFDPGFDSSPTPHLLEQAQSVGMATVEEEAARRPRRPPVQRVTAAQVLTA